jgi:hypothetical protein
LIWAKFRAASYFHRFLKEHQEKQKLWQSPLAQEFDYNLDAFLNAARSVGKLLERKKPKWWDSLAKADLDLHDQIWDMRDDAVYAGQIQTNRKTEEVEVPLEPTYDVRAQVVHSAMSSQSMFGPVTTRIEMQSVNVSGNDREVVALCEDYLALLEREITNLQP